MAFSKTAPGPLTEEGRGRKLPHKQGRCRKGPAAPVVFFQRERWLRHAKAHVPKVCGGHAPILFPDRSDEYGSVGMVSGGRCVGVFHAVRLCHGGDRVYPSEKRGQYHHEEPDGFLHRNGGVCGPGLWDHEQRELLVWSHRQTGVPDVHRFRPLQLVQLLLPAGVLCHGGHHRLGGHGGADQVSGLLHLLRLYQRHRLPH